MSRSLRCLALAPLIMAALAACDDWRDHHSMWPIVWADDDSEIALVVNTWAQRGLWVNQEYRDHRYQVFVERADGTGRRAISSVSATAGFGTMRSMFFMKRRGYLVLHRQEADTAVFERFMLTGSRHVIATITGAGGRCGQSVPGVLPSPTGDHIALHATTTPCVGDTAGVPGTLVVRMLEATSLAVVRADSVAADTTHGYWRIRWTPSGDLVAVFGASAWSLGPSHAAVRTSLPSCYGAATTSSWISSTGIRVYPEGLTVRKDATPPIPVPAFGCPP